jgi:hypothetical protein
VLGPRSRQDVVAFFWWYLAILVPTLVFKYLYLNAIYSKGFATAIDGITSGASTIKWWLYSLVPFAADLLEVLLLVGLLHLVGHRLLHVKTPHVIVASVLVCLLIGGAGWISVSELGTLPTIDTLAISVAWIWDHPDLLEDYVHSKPVLALVALSLFWPWAPVLISRTISRRSTTTALHLRMVRGCLVFAAILYVLPYCFASAATGPQPLWRGYWTATAISLLGWGEKSPRQIAVPSRSELKAKYDLLVYPHGKSPRPEYVLNIDAKSLRPRHILVVCLETTPKKYYPIINNPDLPNFYRLTQRAIVSDLHYANTPFTIWASFAILSGTYPQGDNFQKYGAFETDGLASILARRGYDTTFIDSFRLDWRKTTSNSTIIKALGFQSMFDTSQDSKLKDSKRRQSYFGAIYAEENSFRQALAAIMTAQAQGRKALVFIQTFLGHYKWKAHPQNTELSGQERLYAISKTFDGLLGTVLRSLEDHGLGDDVLVLVTGDHGLRYKDEFQSLNETMEHSDVAFNVPFLLFAPGVIREQVQLPHVTSHVDITPTLLELVGVDTSTLFHHGSNVLDRRLSTRISFMMNTRLSPIDGFHWNGEFVTHNRLTGEVRLAARTARVDARPTANALPENATISRAIVDPRRTFEAADTLFSTSAAYFLSRK